MSAAFRFDVSPAGTELRLLGPAGPVPTDRWATDAPDRLVAGVDLAFRLVAAESAIADGGTVLIEHAAVAGLGAAEAAAIGLPPPARVVAGLEFHGPVASPTHRTVLTWRHPNGQPVLGAQRTGAWLRFGDAWHRLSATLHAVAEAVGRIAAAQGPDLAGRLSALAALQEVLPQARGQGEAQTQGLVGSMTIAEADAFSLDLVGEGTAARLVPVLHRSGDDADAPLLPPDRQAAFGDDQFNRFSAAKPVYALGGGHYVVLAPPLARALDVVRRAQSAPISTKRALMASPRAFLRDALGDDTDATVIDTVFRETRSYADRVVGLGLWTPRVVPWISMEATDWFDGPAPGSGAGRTPGARGIMLDDRRIPLTPAEAAELSGRVAAAMADGTPSVAWTVGGEEIRVPATPAVAAALDALTAEPTPSGGAEQDRPAAPAQVLLIQANEEEVEFEGVFTPRRGPDVGPEIPNVRSRLKPHQEEGVAWLQRAWLAGRPGVLLADDMGLGKTLQGLAFLAWLRHGMEAGSVERRPILIVAPTGLLENWRAEHDRHLDGGGLGECLRAYGAGLAAMKSRDGDGRPRIDADRLRRADWVLTTYETLRDYDRDFGGVRFAALLFDEAQKIKSPGVRLTDAAKAMNADFRVALTGTPVENRLADLWCIVDAVHPACLQDLKTFSRRYEADATPDTLRDLKSRLEGRPGGRPPLLLRRLKEDRLPDLPRREDVVRRAPMPPVQLAAYRAALDAASDGGARGVLAALQRLRAVCLHPAPDEHGDDEAFVAASARVATTVAILDEVAERAERALVFLESLDLQARLAGLAQRRYRLAAPPMIINGSVAGGARQSRVDRFQAGDGFDVMFLSPRAAGVGLTLTAANHAIHLSRWWNPAVEDQCTGRVHRIGQQRPVRVYVPMAVLPDGRRSFDENLDALLSRKRALMREALMPPEADAEDLKDLVRATVAA
jgi:hypothetical protein